MRDPKRLTIEDLEAVAYAFGFIFKPQEMFDIAEAAEYRLRAKERVA